MAKIELAGQIAEAKRELALRASAYPRLVASNKMRQGEADLCMNRMKAILDTLMFLQTHEQGFRDYIASTKATAR